MRTLALCPVLLLAMLGVAALGLNGTPAGSRPASDDATLVATTILEAPTPKAKESAIERNAAVAVKGDEVPALVVTSQGQVPADEVPAFEKDETGVLSDEAAGPQVIDQGQVPADEIPVFEKKGAGEGIEETRGARVIDQGQIPADEIPAFEENAHVGEVGDRTGECLSGGCGNFVFNYPPGTHSTTSSSWTTVSTGTWAGDYAYYSVTSGSEYEWTLCSADGGVASYDSQLTLWNSGGTTKYCYSDDYCGDDAKIRWTATFSGTVRVLISEYNCLSGATDSTLRWRCSSCGTCPALEVYDAWWSNTVDTDGDGCLESARLNWDPDIVSCSGTQSVYEKVYYRVSPSGSWNLLVTTSCHTITGCSTSDAQYVTLTATGVCTIYDFKIELFCCGLTTPSDVYDDTDDSDLADEDFEECQQDIDVSPLSVTITCPGSLAEEQGGEVIRLKNASIPVQAMSRNDLAGRAPAEPAHVLLHFAQMPDEAGLTDLAEQGVWIVGYVPTNAVVAAVPAGFVPADTSGIDWMGAFEPGYKVSRYVRDGAAAAPSETTLKAVIVEFFPDVTDGDIDAALTEAGVEVMVNDYLPTHVVPVWADARAIDRLAAVDGVAWIMAATQAVIDNVPGHWCPGPMTPWGYVGDYVPHDDGWDGPGQGTACDLKYHFVNGTPDIPGTGEETAVENGINVWTNYVAVRWTETASASQSRSMDIMWASGDHGDGYPFDEAGEILAHCFYQTPAPEPLAGDMHFNEAVTWSLTGDFHQFTVALHESGHGLGLGHSDVPEAVMWPYYTGVRTVLHADDIACIRSIYSSTPCTPGCFTISNVGCATLTVSAITKPCAWATLSPAPPYTILPGANQQVCATVNCATACPACGPDQDCTLTILSNDPDEPSVPVALHVVCPGGSVPSAPTGVTASDGTYCDKVTVNWSTVTGATSYKIYRSTSSSPCASFFTTDTAPPYDDTTATAGTTYHYSVKATNACGDSTCSNEDPGYRATVPSAPTGVTASDGTYCDKVTVNWSTVTGATSYKIYRSTTSSPCASFLATDTAPPYDDTTATAGTTYYYSVKATNACGDSTCSNVDPGYRATVPSAPTGVTASDGTYCDKVTVNWSTVTGATSYKIYRSTTSLSCASFLATDTAPPYDDTTATAGTTYYYSVKATNACGDSPCSNVDPGYRATVPSAPTGVTASDGTYCDKVTVNWSTVTGATSY
ncbi:MAG: matrixin family metalloprotease, partial [Planctomycetota bacterium]